ncbi:MAG: putative transcriptional regulator [Frankiales bacterium]|nr:putative transcriptional regulator [Frankiales bacterium]
MGEITGGRFDVGAELRHNGVVKSALEQAGTRERVLSLLLELGPSTAASLGQRLGLTVAGVRRHLDALVADGSVTTREPRRRAVTRGRPARFYALTEAGHAAGPSGYDELALSALRFMSPGQLEEFAQAKGEELIQRYAHVMTATDRPAALAAAMSEDGYAASVSEQGVGLQLCQQHCPVQHVAAEFPQLCDAETAAIGRLLDVHVQRLATIAHGDGVCTTHIPAHIPVRPENRKKASA